MLHKEQLHSDPYHGNQYMSNFTCIHEAALLKISMTVKSCYTGSCQDPLTTASSAESCLKPCFLQVTFTVCCHKVIFFPSQQTNPGWFASLDIWRTRARGWGGKHYILPR